jgi:hypothetical protein
MGAIRLWHIPKGEVVLCLLLQDFGVRRQREVNPTCIRDGDPERGPPSAVIVGVARSRLHLSLEDPS